MRIRFYGGPLDGEEREVEHEVSEYKVPTRTKHKHKFLEGNLMADVTLLQTVSYHKSIRIGGITNFVYEEPPEVEMEVELYTTKPLEVNGRISIP